MKPLSLVILVLALVGAAGTGTTPRGVAEASRSTARYQASAPFGVRRQPLLSAPFTAAATLGGVASWYDDGPGLYGAAGPVLRKALGGDPAFRGRYVKVCASHCVTILLRDWCQCGVRTGRPTLVDLSPAAFKRLAPLSRGVVAVSIQLTAQPRLPNTDMEGGTP